MAALALSEFWLLAGRHVEKGEPGDEVLASGPSRG
jgi:hypothetical protein